MTDHDLGWVAGFLEGEGCFYLNGSGAHRYCAISATQKQKDPLNRLQSLLGGNIYQTTRGLWHWGLTKGIRAEEMMEILRPLMSPRRQEQIDLVLAGKSVRRRQGAPC